MNSMLHHPILVHTFSYTFFIILISTHPSSSLHIYEECSEVFDCGNIANISYPFRRDDQPTGCGYPGLELSCKDDVASMTINQLKYRVLGMDMDERVLQLARDDSRNGICSLQLNSTTIDPRLFEYVYGYGNITLHYGCPSSFQPFPDREKKEQRQFSCHISGVSNTDGYIQTGPDGDGGCAYSLVLVVPVEFFTESEVNSTVSSRLEEVISRKGFEVKWKVDLSACGGDGECSAAKGKCGYDLSAKQTTCFCADRHSGSGSTPCHSLIGLPDHPGMSSKVDWRLIVVIGILAGMTGMIVIGVVIVCAFRGRTIIGKAMFMWKKQPDVNKHHNVEAFIRNYDYLSPKRFSYSCIKKMTNSFSNKLGEGGYGLVYRGTLQDGRLVAVKILKDSNNDGEEFINEVASISRTSHVNVVTLIGFCFERDKRALLYEFMPNGSLDGFIYDEGSLTRLTWKVRFQIAVGIARGLEYLHRGCSTRIVHFDIKPHNILLDKDLIPKISDFGLAKLCTREESVVSMLGARGTAGYIAPEVLCRNFGGVSHKSDVYSYGMMVLEMVGGRRNIVVGASKTSETFFPSMIYGAVESGEMMKIEGLRTEEEEEIARKMVLVGLWCIQIMPTNRPSISKVLEMLEASVRSLQIPPKPIFTSPPRSPHHSSTISSSLGYNASYML